MSAFGEVGQVDAGLAGICWTASTVNQSKMFSPWLMRYQWLWLRA
jgi:hypothetical protein